MGTRGRDLVSQVSVWKNMAPKGPPNGDEEEDLEPLLVFQTKPRFPVPRPTVLAVVSARQRGLSEHHSHSCHS